MKIGFIGDIHGRVFHCLAAITAWQLYHSEKLDMIIQVGDLGAYPIPDQELKNNKFYLQDPSQFDFSRFLKAEGDLADHLHYIRKLLLNPLYFIRGNHEDFQWLNKVSSSSANNIVSIDPFDLFYYVEDGTILEINGMKIAFLGGIETTVREEKSINEEVYLNLLKTTPGVIDILVSHDAPYGIGTNYHGQVQGSAKISNLIDQIQPKYLIAGHYHHMNGPRVYGNTKYLGLNVIIDLRQDVFGRVQAGSLAILDTVKDEVDFVTDDWLSKFDKEFDFMKYCDELKKKEGQ